MKYKKLTGIILKKQNYREADQILTLWTKQAGKVRCLARGVRLPKSKLNFCLAELGICEVDLAGNHGLATLIGAKSIKQFGQVRENLKSAAMGFYAAELMLKMTADEHPNEPAFELLMDFLVQLEASDGTQESLTDNFVAKLPEVLGFGAAKDNASAHDFVEEIIERKIHSKAFLLELN